MNITRYHRPWTVKPPDLVAYTFSIIIDAVLAVFIAVYIWLALFGIFLFTEAQKAPVLSWDFWIPVFIYDGLILTGLVVFYVGRQIYRRVNRYRYMKRYRAAAKPRQVYVCHTGLRRFFWGSRAPIYDDHWLGVRGRLSIDLTWPIAFAIIFWLTMPILAQIYGSGVFAVFVVVSVIAMITAKSIEWFANRLHDERFYRTIYVSKDNVRDVSIYGPLVTLKFSNPPLKGLTGIDLAPHRSEEEAFFQAIGRLFPGCLPSAYVERLELSAETADSANAGGLR